MPLYSYECCGKVWDSFHTVEEREHEVCKFCGKNANKVISNRAKPIVYNFFSRSLGQHVTGRKQRYALMKEKGLEEVD